MSEKKVVIYSTPTCHFCQQAKKYFEENDVDFEDYNVLEDEERRKELVDKSGQMGVPVILIGDEVVVGFDKEKISKLLNG